MHEMSLAREMVRLVEQQCDQHGYRQVKKIHLQLGAFSCVAPEALCFAFDSMRIGRFEDTKLKIRQVEVNGNCGVCGYQEMLSEAYAACARCGGVMMPNNTDEMRITELEVI
jgi:hydrogenase nickel incorporation protein HypA/HybF